MKTLPFEHIMLHNSGYLITPMSKARLSEYMDIEQDYYDHEWLWTEYATWNSDIYPEFLGLLADHGIAFGWEFVLTEHFSYYAYNFPTPEKKNNLICYSSMSKHSLPRMTKKLRLQLETESSINELLLSIGIKPDGTN